MFRSEQRDGVEYLIQEIGIAWEPDKSEGVIVSFINVEEIITQLKENFDIVGVYFDQWNSATMIQRLNKAGIASSEYKLGIQDYKDLKERLYLHTIRRRYK